MLTVELRVADNAGSENAEVEIFCDAVGLEELIKQLGHLRSGSTHVHLMTAAWAGTELSDKPMGKGTELINHLRISLLR